MIGITNKTHESFDFAQHRALIDCGEILSKAFQQRIHIIYINPCNDTRTGIGTVVMEFDKFNIDGYGKGNGDKDGAIQR